MKTIIAYLIIAFTSSVLFSQSEIPTEAINGTYHLLEAEKRIGNKPTKSKLFQYGEFAGDKVLAIAACAQCMLAIYKYQKDESKELGIPVFYNDNESFVMVKAADADSEDWTDFSYSNFYSKNEAKVIAMTQQKIKAFVVAVSE
ncbi:MULTISPECIES: hypothetical protein [Winogradskyella]|uniref:hypothetical protein n=1 Tax=Winogradskyella TaxID=286104 RepID=UPI0015C87143|nr:MULTISPECIES: hypothetical protein [Winogradskyella]QXP79960.1 hypothetical protein H0I32_04825 [Winogradskyella sp. HaHa_3_26]